jgi:MSHA biogenesis protein MshJ
MKHLMMMVERMRLRFDARSLRERAMLFIGAAALIVYGASYTVLNPMFARQAALRAHIAQQQNLSAGIDAEITQKVLLHAADPDAPVTARIAAARQEAAALAAQMRDKRSSLVAPEDMAPLLESLLKVNGKLKLDSLVTVPQMSSPSSPSAPAGAPAAPLFYRHGVQLTVSGSYPDMIAYMEALEAMPTRVFWGSARLDAAAYPQASLSLTVYTLSLDPAWMSL